jgi:hypothetical protein
LLASLHRRTVGSTGAEDFTWKSFWNQNILLSNHITLASTPSFAPSVQPVRMSFSKLDRHCSYYCTARFIFSTVSLTGHPFPTELIQFVISLSSFFIFFFAWALYYILGI